MSYWQFICSILLPCFLSTDARAWENVFNFGQSSMDSWVKEWNSTEFPEPNCVRFGRPFSCSLISLGKTILINFPSPLNSSVMIIPSIDLQFRISRFSSCTRLLTIEYENRNFKLPLHSSTVKLFKVWQQEEIAGSWSSHIHSMLIEDSFNFSKPGSKTCKYNLFVIND